MNHQHRAEGRKWWTDKKTTDEAENGEIKVDINVLLHVCTIQRRQQKNKKNSKREFNFKQSETFVSTNLHL